MAISDETGELDARHVACLPLLQSLYAEVISLLIQYDAGGVQRTR
jgi:hypothetical protein